MNSSNLIHDARNVKISDRKRLGDILVERGLVSQQEIDAALLVQKQTGLRLGQVLTAAAALSDGALVEVLSLQLDAPAVQLEVQPADDSARELVGIEFALEHRAVPFMYSVMRNVLGIAFEDPTESNVRSFEDRFGVTVEAYLAPSAAIDAYTSRLYNWSPHRRTRKTTSPVRQRLAA